jgi:hypothetical protein
LAELGYHDAAVALLKDHFSEVKRAMDATTSAPASAPIPVVVHGKPDWCMTAQGIELRNYPECR